jgi:predicted NAD-dependent protein-ADP-ribosyltransferase YbiA (DUF1768 family)
MSQYPIDFGGVIWKTTEALFQGLRFRDNDIKELIRNEKSPMGAKEVMRSNFKDIIVTPHSKKDISNMKMCLVFKLMQHPKLIEELINTGDLLIVEDVTTRGNVGGNLFWGAMLVNNEWVGENTLGKIWMDLRNEHKKIGI